jgi:hypothetical protein
MLKGAAYTVGIILLMALWLVPNPVGKIVEVWRFFRGDRLD